MQLTKKVIGEELQLFEQHFKDSIKSHVPLLDRIMTYIVSRKGKQMRPMFVLLSSRLGGAINDRSYRAALFVEILHTSSLVHDDLVDDSIERRGAFSINALWKNRTAVFVGDNLFTKSILLLLKHEDHRILKIYSDAIGKVIEGELLQMEKSNKLNLKEEVYYEIIKGKTATLLAACCAAGAASTFEEEDSIQKMYRFGETVGIAFQIKDDLLDYGDAAIGKPTGNDIKEKKITLPLLYTLNNCDTALRKKMLNIIKHHNTDKEMVDMIVAEVIKAGGIKYAEEKMLLYRDEALKLLYEFPPSDVRSALEELVLYTTDRSY
ncbi:MAG TPA: polyprenyl synthetase family protein [Puia sp.]